MKYNLSKIMMEDLPQNKEYQLCRSTSQSMVICKGRRNQCKENRDSETGSRNHRGNQYLC